MRMKRFLSMFVAGAMALSLAACGGAVALMATGILWLLPKAHALIAGPVPPVPRQPQTLADLPLPVGHPPGG